MPTSKKLLVFLFAMALALPMSAAENISYHLDWDQPNSHLLHITMTIDNIDTETIEVALPNWRPGRYVMQNFSKNIVSFGAENSDGQPLSFKKISKSSWRIQREQASRVLVKYDYYARKLDGGESYLDDSELYVNPITCLMYIPGSEMQPVSLTMKRPKDWKMAIAAQPDTTGAYTFPNFHEAVDTPFIMSPDLVTLTFEQKGATFEIALQGEANYDSTRVLEDVKKIVTEQMDMMQDVPFKRYVFLYHLVPYPMGHGVEHKNSTCIVVGPADFNNDEFQRRFLGVTAHEFFHVWNVERIRPAAIYYPDYAKENYTTTMWMYEGITSYFTGVTLARTGLSKLDKVYENLARQIRGYQNAYGRNIASVSQVSWDSWAKDNHNTPPNSYYSYYTKGAIIGLLLDLEIRHRTKNKKSLLHVMRHLNETFAKQNRGVPEQGLRAACMLVAGSDFSQFFADFVDGTTEIDYNQFLNHAGLELTREVDKKSPGVWLGVEMRGDEKETSFRNVAPNSPAFMAGLDLGDVLLAVDGRRAQKDNLAMLLKRYAPGDTIEVTIFRRSKLKSLPVVLGVAAPDKYKIKKIENTSKLQDKIRKDWLNEKPEDKE